MTNRAAAAANRTCNISAHVGVTGSRSRNHHWELSVCEHLLKHGCDSVAQAVVPCKTSVNLDYRVPISKVGTFVKGRHSIQECMPSVTFISDRSSGQGWHTHCVDEDDERGNDFVYNRSIGSVKRGTTSMSSKKASTSSPGHRRRPAGISLPMMLSKL